MSAARLAAAVTFCLAIWGSTAWADDDPIALYGDEIRFDIQRKGKTVGSHVVTFQAGADSIRTRSDVQIAIDVLFFKAFRYHYQSEAVWRQGRLQGLSVDIVENGKHRRLNASRDGEIIAVSGSDSLKVPDSTHPTEHWNAGILKERRVLNTLTGKMNNVVIESGGREYVATERGPVPANTYRYTGDLSTEVWYDDHGRWVKMRFKGRDGSTIEYLCRRCQGPAGE